MRIICIATYTYYIGVRIRRVCKKGTVYGQIYAKQPSGVDKSVHRIRIIIYCATCVRIFNLISFIFIVLFFSLHLSLSLIFFAACACNYKAPSHHGKNIWGGLFSHVVHTHTYTHIGVNEKKIFTPLRKQIILRRNSFVMIIKLNCRTRHTIRDVLPFNGCWRRRDGGEEEEEEARDRSKTIHVMIIINLSVVTKVVVVVVAEE